jgi:hypothetical protein
MRLQETPCALLPGRSHADTLRADRPRKKNLTTFFKNITRKNKSSDAQDKNNGKKNGIIGSKSKRHFGNNGTLKNNPYPQSGHHLHQRGPSVDSSENGNLSFSVTSRRRDGNGSLGSLPHDRDVPAHSNRSGAPTLATKAETVHSDAGHSKAATTTTHGGALSSIDGAGADSTFSSARNSQRSLTTTLTTIHSNSPGTTLQTASGQPNAHHHGSLNNPNPVMFSHQYPVSPAPSTGTAISAIPRHLMDPNTYNSATANNLLSDNASILTLASSSKRRRRSMDTDASVRALAPSSVWGGSRESLPLSVLSGNADAATTTSGQGFHSSQSRPSIGGLASTERASVYSQPGVTIASERNSYYSYRPNRDLGDAKSLRSVTGLETRSLAGDTRSINADAKSVGGDVGSLKGGEGSVRSGAVGHSRNDSIPGSIGGPPNSSGQRNANGTAGLSRRSSDWQEADAEGEMKQSLEHDEPKEREMDEMEKNGD